jgi:flagellar export protein FliJ
MKAYKFRFEKVLSSKKIIVDDLASKTGRARKILLLEMRKLDDLRKREGQCIRELTLQQVGRVNADEVKRSHQYLQQIGAAIAEQDHRVKEISRRVDMLHSMLVQAEKERRIFEKLDEHEREEFQRAFARKEQQTLDEVGINKFVLRNAYRQAHSS